MCRVTLMVYTHQVIGIYSSLPSLSHHTLFRYHSLFQTNGTPSDDTFPASLLTLIIGFLFRDTLGKPEDSGFDRHSVMWSWVVLTSNGTQIQGVANLGGLRDWNIEKSGLVVSYDYEVLNETPHISIGICWSISSQGFLSVYFPAVRYPIPLSYLVDQTRSDFGTTPSCVRIHLLIGPMGYGYRLRVLVSFLGMVRGCLGVGLNKCLSLLAQGHHLSGFSLIFSSPSGYRYGLDLCISTGTCDYAFQRPLVDSTVCVRVQVLYDDILHHSLLPMPPVTR